MDLSYSNNNDLINELIRKCLIQTIDVEKVFRSVDRRLYYPDTEFQSDIIHLYSTCVYAMSLECLDLRPGNKYLHIGSGIGYFSTLAGLLLGVNGINHGIEIHQFLIDCAHQKLKEFKLNSAAIDYYHFCEPVFIQGNVCQLATTGFYDRVYCGVGVPDEQLQFIKSLIKVGGLLITPLINGTLVKITREDEYSWTTLDILSASFKNLVLPENVCSINKIKFPSVEPLTLQKLCRSRIRSLLSENLKNELPICTKLCSPHNVFMIKNVIDHFRQNNLIDRMQNISDLMEILNDDDDDDIDLLLDPSDDDDDEDSDSSEGRRIYKSFINDTSDEDLLETLFCQFTIERKKNKLSKLLENKINSLPTPNSLKAFLNYDLDD